MDKVSLSLEDLHVESFETTPKGHRGGRGTVFGFSGQNPDPSDPCTGLATYCGTTCDLTECRASCDCPSQWETCEWCMDSIFWSACAAKCWQHNSYCWGTCVNTCDPQEVTCAPGC
jgi:hypothetical protein